MRRPRLTLVLAASVLLSAMFRNESASAEVAFTGTVDVEAGGVEHPLGVALEPSTPYAGADLALRCSLGSFTSQWRLTYEGSVNRFDPDVGLDHSRHAIGVEWIRGAERDAITWSAGAQLGARSNESLYAPYDYRQGFGYVALKTYAAERLLTEGFVGLRLRDYQALPEESYLEPHAVLVSRYFFDRGTSFGTTLRAGGKWYHEPVARRVWDSGTTPSTSQVSASLDVTHSLSRRIGIRASVQERIQTSAFPYFVEDDLYDSPLLDRYASAGSSIDAAVKVFGPGQVWAELGYAWWEDDYRETLFADGAGGSNRLDRTSAVSLSLERRFLRDGRGMVLHAALYHHDQRSNLAAYDWAGWTSAAGVSWKW
jgi:hypothetical protein